MPNKVTHLQHIRATDYSAMPVESPPAADWLCRAWYHARSTVVLGPSTYSNRNGTFRTRMTVTDIRYVPGTVGMHHVHTVPDLLPADRC